MLQDIKKLESAGVHMDKAPDHLFPDSDKIAVGDVNGKKVRYTFRSAVAYCTFDKGVLVFTISASQVSCYTTAIASIIMCGLQLIAY